jgi:hypothetical protein
MDTTVDRFITITVNPTTAQVGDSFVLRITFLQIHTPEIAA